MGGTSRVGKEKKDEYFYNYLIISDIYALYVLVDAASEI